jgi:hypothetical protein
VLVKKPDLAAFGAGARVALRARTAPSEGEAGGLVATTDASGWATFPFVAPNTAFVITASDPDGRFRTTPERIVSSADAGASVDDVVTFTERARTVTLRAVDESGKPLAARPFVRANAGPPAAGEDAVFAANAEGVLRIPVATEAAVDLVTAAEPGVAALGARVAVPSANRAGELDAGGVTFRPLPVLASGRVRSADPAAAAGVNLAAVREQRSPGLPPAWLPDPGLLARTAADGRFVLRGLANGTPLRIRPVRGALRGDGVRCDEGATGVEIVLGPPRVRERVPGPRGSILVDADVPLDLLRASLGRRPEESAAVRYGPTLVPFRELPGGGESGGRRAEFAFPGLEPGTYDFVIESVGGSDPVTAATIQTSTAVTTFGSFGGFEGGTPIFEGPRVEVAAGKPADPRLDGLDVRGRLRVVRGAAVDADGTPVTGAEATILTTAAPARKVGAGMTDAQGRFVIVTSPGPHRIAVRAPGRRTALAPLGDNGQTIVLRRGIPVRVAVRTAPGAPPAGDLRARIEWTTDPASKLAPATDEGTAVARLPDDGWVRVVDSAATLLLPAPGDWRVTLSAAPAGADGRESFAPRAIASDVISVRDSDVEQAFDVVIAPPGAPASRGSR